MIELLTVSEMAEADRLAIQAGTPGIDLMEKAGRGVADAVCRRFDPSASVVVCAGPGNNGGDGFVAARVLRERGFPVRVVMLGERGRLKGDAALAADRYGEAVTSPGNEVASAAVAIDALFGAGLDRPVDGLAAELIAAVNQSGAHVVAVDLPSGVNGDSGAVMGCAVRAKTTVTFFRRKPGHFLLPGRGLCGAVEVVDIGIPESVFATIAPKTFANEPPLWRADFPIPGPAQHKYDRGHTLVVSGGASTTGAARLAARGALRAGSGLVTIASPPDALPIHAAANLAVMVREANGAAGLANLLADPRINAVVLGPGGGVGPEMQAKVAEALGKRVCVLDADALTSFGDNPARLFTLLANQPESRTILTPHSGEFQRLFSELREKIDLKLKLELSRHASHETGSVVVFKGGDTVVAGPDGCAAIAGNASPYLATAGSGDVLAGMIAGLCAQKMPAFAAAAAAVWLHGEAAKQVGPGLISEDLPEMLPRVLRRVFADSFTEPSIDASGFVSI